MTNVISARVHFAFAYDHTSKLQQQKIGERQRRKINMKTKTRNKKNKYIVDDKQQ